MLAFMLDDLRPGNVVFDIGAGFGLYSLVLSSRISDLQFVAFEPNPPTRERLVSAISAESSGYQITVSPLALGDDAGTQPFFVSSQAGRSSALRTIAKHRPRIYFESHARQGARQSAPMILDLLAGYGYVFTDKNSRFRGLAESPAN